MIGLGGCYLLGLALSNGSRSIDDAVVANTGVAESSDLVWAASHPIWNLYLPTASLGLFLIAPLIYALLNHLSAPSPLSVSSLQDAPTFDFRASSRYDLFELRVIAEARYFTHRRIIGCFITRPETLAGSDCSSTSIPTIRDLDVADINDLVWSRTRVK
jgi:hypothetical protein